MNESDLMRLDGDGPWHCARGEFALDVTLTTRGIFRIEMRRVDDQSFRLVSSFPDRGSAQVEVSSIEKSIVEGAFK